MPGWWYTYPSEKYDFVSWDDDIPIYEMENKNHVPVTTHQFFCNFPPFSIGVHQPRSASRPPRAQRNS